MAGGDEERRRRRARLLRQAAEDLEQSLERAEQSIDDSGAGGGGAGGGAGGGGAGRGIKIIVKVFDEQMRPLDGATVKVLGFTGAATVTDNMHEFVEVPAPHEWVIVCELGGYQSQHKKLKVKLGPAPSVIIFALSKAEARRVEMGASYISGKVKDSKGEPINGVRVRIKGTGKTAETDDDGKYNISISEGLEGSYRVIASKPGSDYLLQRRTVKFKKGSPISADFELKKKKEEEGFFGKFDKSMSGPTGLIGPIAGGIILVVLMGNILFFFAFLAWAVHNFIPKPMNWKGIAKKLRHWETELEKETDEKEIKRIEAEVKVLRGEASLMKRGDIDVMGSTGIAFLREFLKILAITLLSIGIITSALPLAVPVGIILLFVVYFLSGGHRHEVKKE